MRFQSKKKIEANFILTFLISSLPVLRRLGILKDGREILKNENSLSMIKVWLVLEVRQFINASIQDVCIILIYCFMWSDLDILTLFIDSRFS